MGLKMDYEKAHALVPDAAHIYVNPTPLETMKVPTQRVWLTELDGATILGTDVPYDAIAAKELIAPPAASE